MGSEWKAHRLGDLVSKKVTPLNQKMARTWTRKVRVSDFTDRSVDHRFM